MPPRPVRVRYNHHVDRAHRPQARAKRADAYACRPCPLPPPVPAGDGAGCARLVGSAQVRPIVATEENRTASRGWGAHPLRARDPARNRHLLAASLAAAARRETSGRFFPSGVCDDNFRRAFGNLCPESGHGGPACILASSRGIDRSERAAMQRLGILHAEWDSPSRHFHHLSHAQPDRQRQPLALLQRKCAPKARPAQHATRFRIQCCGRAAGWCHTRSKGCAVFVGMP